MRLPKKSESWREALQFINRCPLCGGNYEADKAQLFAKNESASMIHLSCSSCSGYFIAMVLVAGHGLSSVGMVTDLSFDDVTRLHKVAPLTTDEMIAGYESLTHQYFLHSLIIQG